MKRRKGVLNVWLFWLLTLFIFSFAYMIFTPIITDIMIPFAEDHIDPTNTDALNVLDDIELIWNLIPYIVIVAFAIGLIVSAQRREPDIQTF